MLILVDASIWIDYFKKCAHSSKLDDLLEDNRVLINDVILAELMPLLLIKKQDKIIELLQSVTVLPLQIDWFEIIRWKTICLTSGINGIGLPDLLIAQNSKYHNAVIYSLDKHFRLLNQVVDIKLLE